MHMFFDFVCKSRRKWNANGTGTAASAIEFEERRVSEVAFGIFFAAVEISGRENGPRRRDGRRWRVIQWGEPE